MKLEKNCLNCGKIFTVDTKELNRGYGKFCNRSCSTKYNNLKKPVIKQKCENCNLEFEAKKISKYCCGSCKSSSYRKKQGEKQKNIKIFYKLLHHLACEICGWDKCTRDIHHVLPVSEGGKNEISNLIVLCPNHHRMAHNNLVSKDDLYEIISLRTISSPSNEGQDAVGSP